MLFLHLRVSGFYSGKQLDMSACCHIIIFLTCQQLRTMITGKRSKLKVKGWKSPVLSHPAYATYSKHVQFLVFCGALYGIVRLVCCTAYSLHVHVELKWHKH